MSKCCFHEFLLHQPPTVFVLLPPLLFDCSENDAVSLGESNSQKLKKHFHTCDFDSDQSGKKQGLWNFYHFTQIFLKSD